MAGGEYIASHTITYEYTYYRRSTSWSPPFNFPMEQREFTRVIFLSSRNRVKGGRGEYMYTCITVKKVE
jgi:hypothetical protein